MYTEAILVPLLITVNMHGKCAVRVRHIHDIQRKRKRGRKKERMLFF